MKKTFYITTAIAYPNGQPHIGHAYEVISADMLARFFRILGHEVHFLTGIDDHGQKMVQTARQMGLDVAQLGDDMAEKFKDMNRLFYISHDDFIRTKEERHKKAACALWEAIEKNGDIYLDTYKGWYALRDEAFYTPEETYLKNGIRYGPTGSPVEWVEEESYFFRLSRYSDRLLELYASNKDFLKPQERLNEVVAFIKNGLSDLSISRTKLDWGIRVPGHESHVMYVWVDALTNYISALGYPEIGEESLFQKFWPANLHIVGKDIVRFHAIIWPALLMAAGLEVPQRVFGHGFLFHKGDKMSKSLGNVISPFDLAKKYGTDAVRYFFLRDAVYGEDGQYSDESMRMRLNADLANDLGNLVQRCLSMIQKDLGGVLEKAHLQDVDEQLLVCLKEDTLPLLEEAAQKCALHSFVRLLWEKIAKVNRYFAAQEPWKCKQQPERLKAILYTTAEALRCLGIMLQPVIPFAADKLLHFLNIPPEARLLYHLKTCKLQEDTRIQKFEPLFPRMLEPISL